MIFDGYCIISETSEDRFDETDSLEEAVRIARSCAPKPGRRRDFHRTPRQGRSAAGPDAGREGCRAGNLVIRRHSRVGRPYIQQIFMTKKLYIETVGCQMNVLDSELVVGSLRRQGYELTARAGRRRRDLLQHVQRPPARRGQDLQRPRPAARATRSAIRDKVIGVLGCMAQKDQELILRRAPHVDIVCGTGQLAQLPRADRRSRRTAASRSWP